MKIIKLIKEEKKYIILQVIFDLIGVSCLAVAPLIQKNFFDNTGKYEVGYIIRIIILYFLIHAVYIFSQYLCMIYAFKGGVIFEKDLKKKYFKSLFSRYDYEFRKKEIGDYISFQANDITALEQDYLQPFIDIIRSGNMFVVYSLVLFIGIDWRIALIIITTSIISISVPKIFGGLLEKHRDIYQSELAKYVVKITDLLEGFRLINNRTINNIEKQHEKSLQEVAEKRYSFGKVKSFTLSLSLFLTKMVKVITFISIVVLFCQKEITIGTGVATLSYVSSLIDPIDNILYDITTMRSVRKIRDEYISFIKYKRDNKPKKDSFTEAISLKNVGYEYENFKLQNISFDIKVGKKYIIVGGNGTGKSTLLKLIAGYLKPQAGNILIDGKDINDVDHSDLISYIDQNDHIFKENIENNITVYNSYKYERQKYMGLSPKINQILNSTRSNCQKMSGGERQIISLLRAISKEGDILLMDEPFSAVDYERASILTNAITTDKIFKSKTVVMITHDISKKNIEKFDYQIILKDGKVTVGDINNKNISVI